MEVAGVACPASLAARDNGSTEFCAMLGSRRDPGGRPTKSLLLKMGEATAQVAKNEKQYFADVQNYAWKLGIGLGVLDVVGEIRHHQRWTEPPPPPSPGSTNQPTRHSKHPMTHEKPDAVPSANAQVPIEPLS
jgi:hypothetical protein